MKFFVTFLLSLSVMVYATDKDLSQTPTSFNNPLYVYGPTLDNPIIVLDESFENTTFPPAGWSKANPDGGTGWNRQVAGTTPIPGWQGGTITTPNDGGTAVAYCTWNTGGATSNDQWLFTPQISSIEANDSLSFWLRKFGSYLDKLEIRISTTTPTVPAMTVNVADLNFVAADSGWVLYKYRIGNLVPAGSNIYIGFREVVADNFNDGAAFSLDLVKVSRDLIPVELISFNGTSSDNNVLLSWSTATETNNKGFEVQRKVAGGEFGSIAFLNGNGTTTIAQNYSYSDNDLNPGKYSYRLKQVDFDGTIEYSNSVEVEIIAPAEFGLEQNYPNPFNPSTAINFSLAVDSKVSLKVFNILGQEVSTLLSKNISAGKHKIDFNASSLNSGVYLYKLEAAGIDGSNYSSIKKMILTK